jgi:hypothetical protein
MTPRLLLLVNIAGCSLFGVGDELSIRINVPYEDFLDVGMGPVKKRKQDTDLRASSAENERAATTVGKKPPILNPHGTVHERA